MLRCDTSSRHSSALTALKSTSIHLPHIFCPELWSTEIDPEWQTASLGDFPPKQAVHYWSQSGKGQFWILWMPLSSLSLSFSLFTYYWNDKTQSEDLAGRDAFSVCLRFLQKRCLSVMQLCFLGHCVIWGSACNALQNNIILLSNMMKKP